MCILYLYYMTTLRYLSHSHTHIYVQHSTSPSPVYNRVQLTQQIDRVRSQFHQWIYPALCALPVLRSPSPFCSLNLHVSNVAHEKMNFSMTEMRKATGEWDRSAKDATAEQRGGGQQFDAFDHPVWCETEGTDGSLKDDWPILPSTAGKRMSLRKTFISRIRPSAPDCDRDRLTSSSFG